MIITVRRASTKLHDRIPDVQTAWEDVHDTIEALADEDLRGQDRREASDRLPDEITELERAIAALRRDLTAKWPPASAPAAGTPWSRARCSPGAARGTAESPRGGARIATTPSGRPN
jgi:hypothetical protein